MATIRPRRPADLDECAAVLRLVHAHSGYPVQGLADARAFLGDGPAWIAEREDGAIAGHVIVTDARADDPAVARWRATHPPPGDADADPDADDGLRLMGRLFVHPDMRGAGLAERLVAAAAAWAAERRLRLVLFALRGRDSAVRLYERLGWVDFGEVAFESTDGKLWPAVCFASPPSPSG